MYKTKLQIDKHVDSILSTIKDPRDRQAKGFQIAKIYYEAKEFDTANRYLSGYLARRDDYAPAHKLMGQIFEATGQYEKAIASYKRSLDLDEKQTDVLIKICENYCLINTDAERAMYWAERLEKALPDHDAVYRLKEHVLSGMTETNSDEQAGHLEDLLTDQLAKNPRLAAVRIKLLRLFVKTKRVNEAFMHATQVEKRLPYPDNVAWYRCLLDVLQLYRSESGSHVNGTYHQTLLHVLNSIVILSLRDSSVKEVCRTLYTFDQTLQSCESQPCRGETWTVLLNEMRAQFFFHVGSVLLKKCRDEDSVTWKEAGELAAVCYLACLSYRPPNIHAPWFAKADAEDKRLYEHWYSLACLRMSQAGHMVRNLNSGVLSEQWIDRITTQICTDQGKDRIFLLLFNQSLMKEGRATSFFMRNAVFMTFTPEVPTEEQLRGYEQVSQMLVPEDLHSLVWTAAQYHSLTDTTQPPYDLAMFEGLQHGVLNLESSSPESLCLIDMEAFLCLCVREAALRCQENRRLSAPDNGVPRFLPSALQSSLVTKQQQEWWTAAYQLQHSIAREQLGRLRLTLQRGLESVRALPAHGLYKALLVHLARIYESRTRVARESASSVLSFANEVASLQARASAYWRAAVTDIQQKVRGLKQRPVKDRLFDLAVPDPSEEELLCFLEEGRFYLATVAMEDNKTQEAIELFEQVANPESAYYQAQLYKRLAEEAEHGGDDLGASRLVSGEGAGNAADVRNTQVALYTKARDRLYLCLDRLRGNHTHRFNEHLVDDIDEIEAKLRSYGNGEEDVPPVPQDGLDGSRVPQVTLDYVDAELSDNPSHNVTASGGFNGAVSGSKSFMMMGGTPSFVASTPRRRNLNASLAVNTSNMSRGTSGGSPSRARPSPERLDAQLRHLSYNQDSVMITLLDEMKEQRRTIQQLQEKLESERARWDEERARLRHDVYEAEKQRDDERRRNQFDGSRLEDERVRLEARLDDERRRMNERYTEDKSRVEEMRRELASERESWREEKAVWAAERREQLDNIKQLQLQVKELQEQLMRQKAAASLSTATQQQAQQQQQQQQTGSPAGAEGLGVLGMTAPPQPHMPGMGMSPARPPFHPVEMYAQALRAYPGYDMMAGYPGYAANPAALAASQYSAAMTAGLRGYTYQDFPAQQSGGGGAIKARGGQHKDGEVAAEDFYFEESEEDEDEASAYYTNPQTGASVPQASSAPMPGPGFFSSPRMPVASPAQKPATLGAMAGGLSLTSMLRSRGVASQAQGVSLIQGNSSLPQPATIQPPAAQTLQPGVQPLQPATQPATQLPGQRPLMPASAALESLAGTEANAVAANTAWPGLATSTYGAVSGLPGETSSAAAEPSIGSSFAAIAALVAQKAAVARSKEASPVKPGSGAPSPVKHERTPRKDSGSDNEYYKERHDSYTEPHFEPLVSLTEVETVTGEEDETVMVEARAKLLRFVDGQWKERGLGQIKILKNHSTDNVRVLMRRERILKVCANHLIKPDTKIETRADDRNGKTLTWRAVDYTDDTPRLEQFCCRFKTAESAEEFKRCFDKEARKAPASPSKAPSKAPAKAVETLGSTETEQSGASKPSATKPESSDSPLNLSINKSLPTLPAKSDLASVKGHRDRATSLGSHSTVVSSLKKDSVVLGSAPNLGEADANKAGWGAGGNKSSSLFGLSAAPGGATEKAGEEKASAPSGSVFGGFTFAVKQPTVTEVKATQESSKDKDTGKKTEEKKEPNPFAILSLGSPSAAASASTASKTTEAPLFGSKGPAVDFADLSKTATTGDKGGSKPFSGSGAGFAGQGAPVFGTPKSTTTGKTSPSKSKTTDDGEDGDGEYEPDVSFKPLVSLPEVEKVTGEENEDRLFCQSSKMYRFDASNNQWKERGVGDIKILRHKQTKKCRILMRRKQVLKVCANHYIVENMSIQPLATSAKTLQWTCSDFSEEEVKHEMFAVKFKEQETVDEFLQVFESCVKAAKLFSAESAKSASQPATATPSATAASKAPIPPTPTVIPPTPGVTPETPDSTQEDGEDASWTCAHCFVRNKAVATRCKACKVAQFRESQENGEGSTETEEETGEDSRQDFEEADISTEEGEEDAIAEEDEEEYEEEYEEEEDSVTPRAAPDSTTDTSGGAPQLSLAQQFQKVEGEWDCDTCYVRNPKSAIMCAACQSPQPGFEEQVKKMEDEKAQKQASAAAKFSFGMGGAKSGDFSFGSGAAGTTASGSGVSSTTGSAGGFSFGTPVSSATTGTPAWTTASAGGFKFGSGGATSFGGTPTFGSGMTPKMVSATPSTTAPVFGSKGGADSTSTAAPTMGFGSFSTTDSKADSTAATSTSTTVGFGTFSLNATTSGSIFGGANTTPSSTAKGSIFGGISTTGNTGSIFGAISTPASGAKGSIFGGGLGTPSSTSGTAGIFGGGVSTTTPQPPSALATVVDLSKISPNRGFSFNTSKPTTTATTAPATITSKGDQTPVKSGGTVKDETKKYHKPITGALTPSKSSFGTSTFTFSGVSPQKSGTAPAKSPGGPKTPKTPGEGEDGYYEDDEGAHIHFEPIVQLPQDYEHKTGEEDEELLYTQRAKLFRFRDDQWKERGLGDAKLLQHRETQKVRLVMRREQVFRICLNHYVTDKMHLMPMANANGKAFTWYADDFSDGEVSHENFAMRFKTAEIANHFKAVIELVKAGKPIPEDMKKAPEPAPSKTGGTSEKDQKEASQPSASKEVTSSTETSQSESSNTFTFKSPVSTPVTSKQAAPFSSVKFAAPNFGPGVLGSPSSGKSGVGFAFGQAAASITGSSPFTFGKGTTAQKTPAAQAPNLLSLLIGDSDVPKTTATPTQSQGSLASTQKASLLQSLLSDDGMGSGFAALQSAMDSPQQQQETSTASTSDVTKEGASDADVIVTYERTPTAAQLSRAAELQLPKWFFMYEDEGSKCKGCVGCDPDSFDFDTIGKAAEPEVKAEVSQVTGDGGNVSYQRELDAVKQEEEMISATSAQVTGDRGNVKYGQELDSSQSEPEVKAEVSQVTGDGGNVSYQRELDAVKQEEEMISATSAQVTGDRGNVKYGQELDSSQSESQQNDSALFFNIMRNANDSVGFADLAKAPQASGGFGIGKQSGSAPFQWAGAGASVFGGSPARDGNHSGQGDTEEVEQGPDVHFEPIVSLPEVEVVTGEEDEQVLFCERSKLFRYVTTDKEKAWKERGVGEIKILSNTVTGKFRVLHRREKILKIAANHLITPQMTLQPMASSETAWCWYAVDYAENEAQNEQFALKFKNKELAGQFKEVFERCQEQLMNQPPSPQKPTGSSTAPPGATGSTEPEVVENTGSQAEVSIEAVEESERAEPIVMEEEGGAYAQEEDDEEEEVEQLEFAKRVTMHYIGETGKPTDTCMGELRIVYDDDVMGFRILMMDDHGRKFCNHVICRKYTVQKNIKKKFVEWTAKDFVTDEPLRKTFRVHFSSESALEEFDHAFYNGVGLANESELEEVKDGTDLTGELINPQAVGSILLA